MGNRDKEKMDVFMEVGFLFVGIVGKLTCTR